MKQPRKSLVSLLVFTTVPEDLSGHDEAGRFGTDLDVPREEPDVPECVFKVSELLIGQSLYRRRVDGPLKTQETERKINL